MKKIIMMMLVALSAKADSGWDNYQFNSGEYFSKFFNKPRVLYYVQDRAAHEATLRFMASQGIRYRNQYTGQWNIK